VCSIAVGTQILHSARRNASEQLAGRPCDSLAPVSRWGTMLAVCDGMAQDNRSPAESPGQNAKRTERDGQQEPSRPKPLDQVRAGCRVRTSVPAQRMLTSAGSATSSCSTRSVIPRPVRPVAVHLKVDTTGISRPEGRRHIHRRKGRDQNRLKGRDQKIVAIEDAARSRTRVGRMPR
jgi:hypothetical protein